VIARYGGGCAASSPSWPTHTARIGCLFIRDPRDDGYSVAMFIRKAAIGRPKVSSADPSKDLRWQRRSFDANAGATKDSKRLSIADSKTVLKIPVIPVS